MPAEGGDAEQITRHGGTIASESPDGRHLYFAKSFLFAGPKGIWRMPADGGEEVQVHDRCEYVNWVVLRQGICYLKRDSVPSAVEFFSFETREVRHVASLEKTLSIWGFSVSPDGRWVLYSLRVDEYDIMLVENFR